MWQIPLHYQPYVQNILIPPNFPALTRDDPDFYNFCLFFCKNPFYFVIFSRLFSTFISPHIDFPRPLNFSLPSYTSSLYPSHHNGFFITISMQCNSNKTLWCNYNFFSLFFSASFFPHFVIFPNFSFRFSFHRYPDSIFTFFVRGRNYCWMSC